MRLGTAVKPEGGRERRFLAAPLPSDPARLVDLQAVESERLRKLGEGDPEGLSQALVPASLRRLLEAGPRGIQRARQTLAYAEKWARRGTLPEALAPAAEGLRLLPCLPRPSSLRMPDGGFGDRLGLRGPALRLPWHSGGLWRATLAAVGQSGGRPAGFALAVQAGPALVLGSWLHTELLLEGELELEARSGRRETPMRAWLDLELPDLRAGEIQLLPFPEWEPLPVLPGDRARLDAHFDGFILRVDPEGTHPTLQ
jgi:hypothetical protein